MRSKHLQLIVAVVLLICGAQMIGCSSGPGEGEGGASAGAVAGATGGPCTACVPGDQKLCPCISGKEGVQVCEEDGCGWGTCEGCEESPSGSCGDSVVDQGEECDDGNTSNGDGCNVRCVTEPRGPLPGGDPMGDAPGGADVPVQFAVCDNENTTQAFAPGPVIPVQVCAVRYLDMNGQGGVSEAAIQAEFLDAQEFLTASGANVTLFLLHVDSYPVGPSETDPVGNAELAALHVATRQRADIAHPGECDVVVGYTNTLTGANGPIGGQATWPTQGLHEALVASGNVGSGHTTAHCTGPRSARWFVPRCARDVIALRAGAPPG